MRYTIIVEGITDVAFVKYVCFKKKITENFNDFKLQGVTSSNESIEIYRYNDFYIINLKGQNKLENVKPIFEPINRKVLKVGVLQDADDDFEKSQNILLKFKEELEIDNSKIELFLTPNNRDKGDLETLLLSSLEKEKIPQLQCFQEYKNCLEKNIDITTKAMNKGELYAYTMFSQNGKEKYTPQNSFMYKNKKYRDTGLWDLSRDEFSEIIEFIMGIFEQK